MVESIAVLCCPECARFPRQNLAACLDDLSGVSSSEEEKAWAESSKIVGNGAGGEESIFLLDGDSHWLTRNAVQQTLQVAP